MRLLHSLYEVGEVKYVSAAVVLLSKILVFSTSEPFLLNIYSRPKIYRDDREGRVLRFLPYVSGLLGESLEVSDSRACVASISSAT